MKKLFAIILTVAMLATLSVTALADDYTTEGDKGMTITYSVAPTYTVTIPTDVTINGSSTTISADDVVVEKGKYVSVSLDADNDFTVTTAQGATLTYTVAEGTDNGVFTVEALKALSYEVAYKEIKAENLQNDPTADGCYVFTGTLVNVQEANYTRDFSAIAYVKVGDTYYYSNYNEELNSRNISDVASNACADTSAEQNAVYQYAVTEGEITVYSPYTEEQRKVLADFFQ